MMEPTEIPHSYQYSINGMSSIEGYELSMNSVRDWQQSKHKGESIRWQLGSFDDFDIEIQNLDKDLEDDVGISRSSTDILDENRSLKNVCFGNIKIYFWIVWDACYNSTGFWGSFGMTCITVLLIMNIPIFAAGIYGKIIPVIILSSLYIFVSVFYFIGFCINPYISNRTLL